MIFVADGNGIVHAVRASDGTLAWQAQLGPAITTDVIVSPNDLWLFVGTTSNLLFSISTATGNDCPLSHSTHAVWVQSLSWGGGVPCCGCDWQVMWSGHVKQTERSQAVSLYLSTVPLSSSALLMRKSARLQ